MSRLKVDGSSNIGALKGATDLWDFSRDFGLQNLELVLIAHLGFSDCLERTEEPTGFRLVASGIA